MERCNEIFKKESKLKIEFTTGIKAHANFKGSILMGFEVEWLQWFSHFRKTDLDVGYLITEIDGVNVERFMDDNNSLLPAPTLYNEATYWETNTFQKERSLRIVAHKKGKRIIVEASLAESQNYRQGVRSTLGPDGPFRDERESFHESWGVWYEALIKKLGYLFNDCWKRKSFNNTVEMELLFQEQERMEMLLEKYPNTMTKVLYGDYQRAIELLRPKKIPFSSVDLSYRTIQDKIQQECRKRAQEKWHGERAVLKNKLTTNVIRLNDLEDNTDSVFVQTKGLSYQNSIEDLGKGYFMLGDERQGFNYIAMNGPKMTLFYDVFLKYKSEVNPKVLDKFQFVGKVVNNPRMLSYRNKQYDCLEIEPIFVLAGDKECFVDLTSRNPPKFEGEELTDDIILKKPEISEGPESFLLYYFELVKRGYRAQWEGCYSEMVINDYMGELYVSPAFCPESKFYTIWQEMRKQILTQIAHVEIKEIEPLENPENSNMFNSFEAVTIWVDYFQEGTGTFEVFKDLTVHRGWTLTNIDREGWKINGFRGFK